MASPWLILVHRIGWGGGRAGVERVAGREGQGVRASRSVMLYGKEVGWTDAREVELGYRRMRSLLASQQQILAGTKKGEGEHAL